MLGRAREDIDALELARRRLDTGCVRSRQRSRISGARSGWRAIVLRRADNRVVAAAPADCATRPTPAATLDPRTLLSDGRDHRLGRRGFRLPEGGGRLRLPRASEPLWLDLWEGDDGRSPAETNSARWSWRRRCSAWPFDPGPRSASGPREVADVSMQTVKRAVLGEPIPTSHEEHERLGRATGLAVFASDALSSSAYATEEILLILALAGTGALHVGLPISLGIAGADRYRGELLPADDHRVPERGRRLSSAGRTSWHVSQPRRGRRRLLTDYVLTVSVSVAAGIAAVTSAVPTLYPYRVELLPPQGARDHGREPARRARVRAPVRRSDVRVHRILRPHDRLGRRCLGARLGRGRLAPAGMLFRDRRVRN